MKLLLLLSTLLLLWTPSALAQAQQQRMEIPQRTAPQQARVAVTHCESIGAFQAQEIELQLKGVRAWQDLMTRTDECTVTSGEEVVTVEGAGPGGTPLIWREISPPQEIVCIRSMLWEGCRYTFRVVVP